MEREYRQFCSDLADFWNASVKAGTFLGLAFIGLFVLAGEGAKLAHAWLGRNRHRTGIVVKILDRPDGRGRMAGL